MSLPRRQTKLAGRFAMADGIPFTFPVDSIDCPVRRCFGIRKHATLAAARGQRRWVSAARASASAG